jgi:transposase-like protein
MKKRQKFECWNCHRNFSLFLEITKEQTLTVPCPFCAAECVADLEPHRKKVKPVMRGEKEGDDMPEVLDLPEVLPTQQK